MGSDVNVRQQIEVKKKTRVEIAIYRISHLATSFSLENVFLEKYRTLMKCILNTNIEDKATHGYFYISGVSIVISCTTSTNQRERKFSKAMFLLLFFHI